MNPAILKSLLLVFSLKQELKYVTFVFLFVLFLPIVAIIVITHTGIELVSDKLATINLTTNSIEILDPATGNVLATINAQTTWPVQGITTTEFGEPHLPYQLLHTGIDIANPQNRIGDPITPFMKGKVSYIGNLSWGYGKHVIIDHGNNISSVYAHLHTINVEKDQEVAPGNVIGTEGSTGWSTGPHLHFETRVFGIPVNPNIFFK